MPNTPPSTLYACANRRVNHATGHAGSDNVSDHLAIAALRDEASPLPAMTPLQDLLTGAPIQPLRPTRRLRLYARPTVAVRLRGCYFKGSERMNRDWCRARLTPTYPRRASEASFKLQR